jgi:hypothetical protein
MSNRKTENNKNVYLAIVFQAEMQISWIKTIKLKMLFKRVWKGDIQNGTSETCVLKFLLSFQGKWRHSVMD